LTNALPRRCFDRYRAIAGAEVPVAILCVGPATAEGLGIHHYRDMLESARNLA